VTDLTASVKARVEKPSRMFEGSGGRIRWKEERVDEKDA
jgi:hypothetical protein